MIMLFVGVLMIILKAPRPKLQSVIHSKAAHVLTAIKVAVNLLSYNLKANLLNDDACSDEFVR
jgi:hypothetical protein